MISKSDEERARDLEKYGRYSTKGDSEEMVAVYLRALTAVRAEASAAKGAEIAALRTALEAVLMEAYPDRKTLTELRASAANIVEFCRAALEMSGGVK